MDRVIVQLIEYATWGAIVLAPAAAGAGREGRSRPPHGQHGAPARRGFRHAGLIPA